MRHGAFQMILDKEVFRYPLRHDWRCIMDKKEILASMKRINGQIGKEREAIEVIRDELASLLDVTEDATYNLHEAYTHLEDATKHMKHIRCYKRIE